MVIGPAPQPSLGVFGLPSVQWIVLLTAVGASAIACLAFTRPLRRRLLRLQTAAESLALGDLGARVNLKTNDEIGAVGQQFDRMAERIDNMMRARQELFRNVSHEIRSPLARIEVALVLAEEGRGELDETLARIRRETEEIESLMKQILGLATLEDWEREEELEDLDLVEVVSLVVDDALFETKTQKKSVSWDPPAGSFKVRGLTDMLSSAIENVLRNAIAHTPDDTRVDVTLKEADGTAELRISDCGNGVAGGELEQIFEPFYRVGNKKMGSGIGLAITRTAVSLMRGTVDATMAPGGGLLVTMKLPLA
jgi:signal transduction histidine kinase